MRVPNKHSASARGKSRFPDNKCNIGAAVFEADLGFAAEITPLRQQVVRPISPHFLQRAFE